MTQEAVTAARTLAGACADALRVARRSPMVAAYLHGSLVLGDCLPRFRLRAPRGARRAGTRSTFAS